MQKKIKSNQNQIKPRDHLDSKPEDVPRCL